MINIGSYLLTSSYSSSSPLLNTVSAACSLNGQDVPCNLGLINGLLALIGVFSFLFLLLMIFMIVSYWKIYTKAGQPGWASIIPFYNIVILLKIINKPVWWIVMLFVPVVNIVFAVIITHQLSKSFGQDIGFTIGLIILPYIFYPVLAFGKYSYVATIQTTQNPIQKTSTETSIGTPTGTI